MFINYNQNYNKIKFKMNFIIYIRHARMELTDTNILDMNKKKHISDNFS